MTSRYIPKKISDHVKKRHFFECAWCCTLLTDRHHINEFSQGGKHTIDNLILLCPNCHRQTHNGEISENELVNRINNHRQGDRISGSINLKVEKKDAVIGGMRFINTNTIVKYKSTPIIEFQNLENGYFSIKTRFYDVYGNLIFWLSKNRYWTSEPFIIQSEKNSLFIKNKNTPQYLIIELKDKIIYIKGINFINKNIIHFTEEYTELNWERSKITISGTYQNLATGIQIGNQQ